MSNSPCSDHHLSSLTVLIRRWPHHLGTDTPAITIYSWEY